MADDGKTSVQFKETKEHHLGDKSALQDVTSASLDGVTVKMISVEPKDSELKENIKFFEVTTPESNIILSDRVFLGMEENGLQIGRVDINLDQRLTKEALEKIQKVMSDGVLSKQDAVDVTNFVHNVKVSAKQAADIKKSQRTKP